MIPKEILEQALADYEKAVKEIQGTRETAAAEYLEYSRMDGGLCYYLKVKFGIRQEVCRSTFGSAYLGGGKVLSMHSFGCFTPIPELTARLQLRIDKLKELLNDNPLPLPK